ncbi:tannase and feruloyl esterase [Punctularia strigosozonata HHB-11173 SS5]|uniref:Carboxylic ester hydrolase n=1 Tax=Punctularia strigosozonata (strain HHB-11173) TaxID=741275 RepID=R7S2M6_PUNST|nr:tannase and feruloyl esterase [Punctularia strigosozonata HHB-11173 SS5]EIN04104.1 tannase and feruloyl esterase [Punctularia strigosozonata HHB-11173 SS5]
MHRRSLRLLFVLIHVYLQVAGGAYIAPRASDTGADACAAFKYIDPGVAETTADNEFYEAGGRVHIENPSSSINSTHLPAFCRVQIKVVTNPATNKTANAEVWLPEDWNGRFLAVGNGGHSGGVTVEDLGFVAVAQGFAGVSTDTGHNGTSGDTPWPLHNDDAIIDWSWRAMHVSVQVGKEVVKQYYQQAANKSYYIGCSTGGRQGLKEVQMFPEDFDGVVVGSPANWMTHVQPWSLHVNGLVQPVNSSGWISADTWQNLIHNEVLKQCDGLDGVEDGILNDPTQCNFDPSPITCPTHATDSSDCLTSAQVAAFTQVFSDYVEANNTFIFNGLYLGGELDYPNALVGDHVSTLALYYERYFVMNDSDWHVSELDLAAIELGDKLDVGQANAIEANISAFTNSPHNGKIIHYVGLADQLISPGNSKLYYDSVKSFMEDNDLGDIDDAYRLFPVPGMKHCKEGFGANAFGGVMQASSGQPPLENDSKHNILQALVAWVENGAEPVRLEAAWYVDDDHNNGIGFTRPLCKLSEQNVKLDAAADMGT